jgi:multiple sugar transport system substrate-binding protein
MRRKVDASRQSPETGGKVHRRELLKGAAAGALAFAGNVRAPAVLGQVKPFAGTTLNISCWSAPYPKFLVDYLPEFTEATGIKVNYDTPGFPVYNQRVDLELSTKGSAYDVLNITFIYTSRWIGAGWFTPIDDFIKDTNKTPSDFDFADFNPGAVAPLKDKKGANYGVPWLTDVLMAGCSRFDLFKQAGLGMPDTFDEMEKAMAILHKKDGVPAFLTDNHWGWTFIPYLHSYGGNVFRNPPDDLMPTLDTPEAAAAAEFFSQIVRIYGPEGAIGYNYDQAVAALVAGRANYSTNNHVFLALMGAKDSKVTATTNFSLIPKGPKGRFPGIATHGWGIPIGSKNKDAAWQFIIWSMSKKLLLRMAQEKQVGSITRKSVIEAPEYKKQMMINGVDTGQLFLDTLKFAEQGHMRYRTVHVYPQVNAQITQAISRIASGQMGAKESMALAQQNSLADLRRSGVRL